MVPHNTKSDLPLKHSIYIFCFVFQHTSSESFSIALSDVLKMIFINDQVYLSLHWTGDADYDDTRIWVQTVVHREKSEPVMVYNSFEMASFTEE